MTSLFEFPNPVNEKAARTVAGVVAVTAAIALVTGWTWLVLPLAYGFVARTLTGPTLSPLGRVAVRVAATRLGPPVHVPGPPKRFAQAIGAVCTVAGSVLWATGAEDAARALLALIAVFATLESVWALCVGCKLFALLMRVGVIPDDVCAACADLSLRRAP